MSDRGRSFRPAVRPAQNDEPAEEPWWFLFRGAEIVVSTIEYATVIPRALDLSVLGFKTQRTSYLGRLPDAHVYAAELRDETRLPDRYVLRGLRALYGLVDEETFALAGRASQILEWDRSHRYCGRCGSPTEDAPNERAKRCPACGHVSFPRLSPAIITLVERGDEVLLARHTRTTDGMFALFAGFVEPGESIEEAVCREIEEEAGIDVDRLVYFGSQPWPFPHQLMIGFTAQYAGGALRLDEDEIADARWFTADALPKVPHRLSIARRLIDAYAAKHGVTIDQP